MGIDRPGPTDEGKLWQEELTKKAQQILAETAKSSFPDLQPAMSKLAPEVATTLSQAIERIKSTKNTQERWRLIEVFNHGRQLEKGYRAESSQRIDDEFEISVTADTEGNVVLTGYVR